MRAERTNEPNGRVQGQSPPSTTRRRKERDVHLCEAVESHEACDLESILSFRSRLVVAEVEDAGGLVLQETERGNERRVEVPS